MNLARVDAAVARERASAPLTVGFLCSEYPTFTPRHGGIGSFVHTLASALVDDGHQVTIYGFGEDDGTSRDGGVRLQMIRRGDPWSSMRAMQSHLSRDLASGVVEVVESAESEAHCLPGRSGTIVRFHGSHHFWCATLPQPRRYTRLLLEQFAVRRADGLCAVSQFAADVTRRAMRLGQRPIDVLSNPVDTNAFAPAPGTVDPGSILFAGSIAEKKGVRELCASMEAVLRRHPDARLSLVGRDVPGTRGGRPLREELEVSLPRSLCARIHFLGALPRPEVSRLMASAHVCVFPSHMETQGLVLLEAMACGRPVVGPLRGPGPEVLGPDGECGWLADPADPADIAEKICRVLDDATAARLMGERGRKRAVEHFSLPACLSRNVAFYRRYVRRG